MRSLRLRLPLLAMVVLAASLAVSAVVSFQLLQFVRLADLDDALDREERRFQQSVSNIARQRADAASVDITVDLVREAVQEYIALNHTNERYLIQIRIDPITYAAEGGSVHRCDFSAMRSVASRSSARCSPSWTRTCARWRHWRSLRSSACWWAARWWPSRSTVV